MEIRRTIDSVHKISTYIHSSTTHTLQREHWQTQTEYFWFFEDAHTQRVGKMEGRGGRGEVQMQLGIGE